MNQNRNRGNDMDYNFLFFMFVSIALAYFLLSRAFAAKGIRMAFMSERKMEQVRVTPRRSTILSFPAKPGKAILGNKGAFALEYIENDIAINALQSQAASNLFVYLNGRRFSFDLLPAPSLGDEIVIVRDAPEEKLVDQIKVNEK
jgi:hypothetical protein